MTQPSMRRRARSILRTRRALLGACALALVAHGAGCDGPDADPRADDLVRERAAVQFANQEWGAARVTLADLVERREAAFDDLVRAAAIELVDGKTDAAQALAERIERLQPDAPVVDWLKGQLAVASGGFDGPERALPHFRAVVAKRPDDLPAKLALGGVEDDVGSVERAQQLYREVIAVGPENGGMWYVAAIHRLSLLLAASAPDADPSDPAAVAAAERHKAEHQRVLVIRRELEQRSLEAPSGQQVMLGELLRVDAPPPPGIAVEPPAALLPFERQTPFLPELARAYELFAIDLEPDGDVDLVTAGPLGVVLGLQTPDGFEHVIVTGNPTPLARPFDADNDGDLDLCVPFENAFALFTCDSTGEGRARWALSAVALPTLPELPQDVTVVDWDHDGDLDLLIVGRFGVRLWRNDGADDPASGGRFTDASEGSGLPGGDWRWCATEDFDGDNDVDFLLGGPQGPALYDSLRGGRFARKDVFAAGTALAKEPLLADVDGDARPDLWPRGAAAPWRQRPDGTFAAGAAGGAAASDDAPAVLADLDLDGALDLVTGGAGSSARVLLAAGLPVELATVVRAEVAASFGGALAAADLDGDGALDLATSNDEGIELLISPGAAGRAKRLTLDGKKDNRRGVGAVVEYRAGHVYRRIYWRGDTQLLGIGAAETIDVLRVTWPNGAVNTELDVPLVADPSDLDAALGVYEQTEAQSASCPFLYVWNGTTYAFVSDVLGITPLGLPLTADVLVPPDHDEYVLVAGDVLAPRDGMYELQLTEELREVTYLDQVELVAVDHPAGSEVFPNERFTFPPFPEATIHALTETIHAERATDGTGRDWSSELAALDDVHAEPFELEAPQYSGLAKPYTLELAFDAERVAGARRLRLVLTGWFYWADASSNMASARHPRVAFVPPILQVPRAVNGTTEWIDSGPPVGFPAGKTKTMVLDVTDLLPRDDARLRIVSTLRLYWDEIRLAVDDGAADVRTTRAPAASAVLWPRGFSAPLDPDVAPGQAPRSKSRPERFDWDVLAAQPRWNQHPGLYTRYGECVELLGAIDDRFALLGAGDALTVRFDATAFPPVPDGYVRDWLVFFDGWAKDRDPNTHEALEVEPLPFHGMSGYPYGPDERFPDDELHRAWRSEWNTRPGRAWIMPLAPARQAEWLLGP